MSRPFIFGAGLLALLFAAVVWRIGDLSSSEPPFEPKTKLPQAAPLCPWREPASDLQRFFPNATRYEPETRILSGQRLELAERLGRMPTGDENALHLYRSYEEQSPLGTVLTRRVKGAYGAFFKLPAGFVAPLHTHTYDMKVVIVSGTYVQAPEGKPEFRIGPGSYFLQPGGNYRHTTACDPASDCVFFAESNGKFDLHVVDAGKAPAKN